MFLALERKRESLVVGTRRQLRPGKRYEDLCLVKMVTHLQRDSLNRARRDDAQPGGLPRSETGRAEREVPDLQVRDVLGQPAPRLVEAGEIGDVRGV